jgi:hypothetical protein
MEPDQLTVAAAIQKVEVDSRLRENDDAREARPEYRHSPGKPGESTAQVQVSGWIADNRQLTVAQNSMKGVVTMRRGLLLIGSCLVMAIILGALGVSKEMAAPQGTKQEWGPNDRNRPVPPIITPGTASRQEQPGIPPSDAIALFNGKDLSNWESINGGPAKWTVGEGYFVVQPGTGDIKTKGTYGDCQLHVEWEAPYPPVGKDQDRGNSGVFLHALYEIQVLDSYDNPTYADGEAGAVYGQYPPLVNAARKPGEWQTYDIVFHGARFDAKGELQRPARVTVLWNGVLVQDNVAIMGPTAHHQRPPYTPTPEKLPLRLQDHHHPVRYRNLWLRELKEGE